MFCNKIAISKTEAKAPISAAIDKIEAKAFIPKAIDKTEAKALVFKAVHKTEATSLLATTQKTDSFNLAEEVLKEIKKKEYTTYLFSLLFWVYFPVQFYCKTFQLNRKTFNCAKQRGRRNFI